MQSTCWNQLGSDASQVYTAAIGCLRLANVVSQAMHKQMFLGGTMAQAQDMRSEALRAFLTVLIWHGGLC